jgi:hypothetical protein
MLYTWVITFLVLHCATILPLPSTELLLILPLLPFLYMSSLLCLHIPTYTHAFVFQFLPLQFGFMDTWLIWENLMISLPLPLLWSRCLIIDMLHIKCLSVSDVTVMSVTFRWYLVEFILYTCWVPVPIALPWPAIFFIALLVHNSLLRVMFILW